MTESKIELTQQTTDRVLNGPAPGPDELKAIYVEAMFKKVRRAAEADLDRWSHRFSIPLSGEARDHMVTSLMSFWGRGLRHEVPEAAETKEGGWARPTS